ncbi:MAG: hypothetical protein PHY92_01105 [Alphaproteobacteria bacterium]|nr:hypothetical protein [Alphaproteobacteria bacterium]
MSESLEKRLSSIEQRNRRVETDKAWETSWTRRAAIALLTYAAAAVMLFAIKADRPWLGALVPAGGFLLSTLSLPVIKARWTRLGVKSGKGR